MSVDRYRILISILAPVAFFSVVLGALAAIWAMNPSSRWIEPLMYLYDPSTETVTFVRNVKNPPQAGIWAHEIITVSGLQCSASGRAFYEYADENTVTFPVPQPLMRCLTGEARTSTLTWQVLAFGVIPLRPVTLQQTYEGRL